MSTFEQSKQKVSMKLRYVYTRLYYASNTNIREIKIAYEVLIGKLWKGIS
jgi:hypothetical protein